MLKNKKCVIFDLDGTLIDSLWVWRQIDELYLEKKGLICDDNLQEALNGKSFTEAAMFFKEKFSMSESIEEISNDWIDMCLDVYIDEVILKEGALRFVQKVHSMGISLGVGTSNNKTIAQQYLQSKNMTKYFKTIRTSCEVGKGKPNPDVFLKVAQDLNTRPEECLVFEDTLEGVMAAKNAGMQVAAVYDSAHVKFESDIRNLADYYFESLFQAEKAI